MKLKHTTILRKPHSARSARRFEPATDTVNMLTGYDDTDERQLWLKFTSAASGGNPDTPAETDYRVLIGAEDYAAIVKAMCDVDEGAALSAMADELASRIKARRSTGDRGSSREAGQRQ